jgi:hypothetical protein
MPHWSGRPPRAAMPARRHPPDLVMRRTEAGRPGDRQRILRRLRHLNRLPATAYYPYYPLEAMVIPIVDACGCGQTAGSSQFSLTRPNATVHVTSMPLPASWRACRRRLPAMAWPTDSPMLAGAAGRAFTSDVQDCAALPQRHPWPQACQRHRGFLPNLAAFGAAFCRRRPQQPVARAGAAPTGVHASN